MPDGKIPALSEKVRFWEEQYKINQAIIPRIIEMHEVLTEMHKRSTNFSSQIASSEARVLEQVKYLIGGSAGSSLPRQNGQDPRTNNSLKHFRIISYSALALATLALAISLYQLVQ